MSSIGTLPDGSKGWDCNTALSSSAAKAFKAAGYSFAVRYVRRGTPHDFDLSPIEMESILGAGLGLMVVQHVASPGWHPTTMLGTAYGTVAAQETANVGVTHGTTLWLDLEGVARDSAASDVIGYCNAWFEQVQLAGYDPGLYVGDSCGLTSVQLYKDLHFVRYWSAYSNNADNTVAVRGYQMFQHAAKIADKVPGIAFEFDVDVIKADASGGTPALLLP